jgi:hypothetical protein
MRHPDRVRRVRAVFLPQQDGEHPVPSDDHEQTERSHEVDEHVAAFDRNRYRRMFRHRPLIVVARGAHSDDHVAGKRSAGGPFADGRNYGPAGTGGCVVGGAVVGGAVVGGAVVGGAVVGGAVVGGAVVGGSVVAVVVGRGAVVGAVVGRGMVVVVAGAVVVRGVVVVVVACGVVGVVVGVSVVDGLDAEVVGVVVRGEVGDVGVMTPGRVPNAVVDGIEPAVPGMVLSAEVSVVDAAAWAVAALTSTADDVVAFAVELLDFVVVAEVFGFVLTAVVLAAVWVPLSRRAMADAFPSAAMTRRDDEWLANGSRKMPTVWRSASVSTTIATAAMELSGKRLGDRASDALMRTNWLSFDIGTPFEGAFEHELGRRWHCAVALT